MGNYKYTDEEFVRLYVAYYKHYDFMRWVREVMRYDSSGVVLKRIRNLQKRGVMLPEWQGAKQSVRGPDDIAVLNAIIAADDQKPGDIPERTRRARVGTDEEFIRSYLEYHTSIPMRTWGIHFGYSKEGVLKSVKSRVATLRKKGYDLPDWVWKRGNRITPIDPIVVVKEPVDRVRRKRGRPRTIPEVPDRPMKKAPKVLAERVRCPHCKQIYRPLYEGKHHMNKKCIEAPT